MPLLHTHFSIFSGLIAVNVSGDYVPEICLKFTVADKKLILAKNLPDWADQSIKRFLDLNFSLSKRGRYRRKKNKKDRGSVTVPSSDTFLFCDALTK